MAKNEYNRVLSARLAWEYADRIYGFQSSAVARLLIEKGVFTQAELDKAMREQEEIFVCDLRKDWSGLPDRVKKRWLS